MAPLGEISVSQKKKKKPSIQGIEDEYCDPDRDSEDNHEDRTDMDRPAILAIVIIDETRR